MEQNQGLFWTNKVMKHKLYVVVKVVVKRFHFSDIIFVWFLSIVMDHCVLFGWRDNSIIAVIHEDWLQKYLVGQYFQEELYFIVSFSTQMNNSRGKILPLQ